MAVELRIATDWQCSFRSTFKQWGIILIMLGKDVASSKISQRKWFSISPGHNWVVSK